jgi:hypothetical protein
MQSSETGLNLRNREFSANSSLKQVLAMPTAAHRTNFAPNFNRLDQPLASFLLLRRTGRLSAITGQACETTGRFGHQIRTRCIRVPQGRWAGNDRGAQLKPPISTRCKKMRTANGGLVTPF